ncbi:MAG: isocitrate lyase/PEP mutase family protein [Dongiaceae bacterium]
MSAHQRLRGLLAGDELLVAPGVGDGLSARLVAAAGFPLVYASGGAIARGAGLPDLNLLTVGQIVDRLQQMTDAVALPVIADADTGHGGALNVYRTIREYRRAGVAGFHIEDQTYPKRCGHYDDKNVVGVAEMEERLHAACDAADGLLVIARTDALAVEPLERALERAHRYMTAGADMIFVEAPTSIEQIERIARELPYPKLVNMFFGGKTPLVPAPRLAELGYRIVIVPSDLQRAAIAAMQEALGLLGRDGHTMAMADRMVSFADREAIVGTRRLLDQARGYQSGRRG